MPSKFRQHCLVWLVCIVVGFSFSLLFNLNRISVATTVTHTANVVSAKDAAELEQQGKQYYSIAQFDRAIDVWQQAERIYLQSGDVLGRSRVLSNLALAHSQLDELQQANRDINQSLNLLERSQLNSDAKAAVLAQIYNNRGILELNLGKTELAIASWQRARINYQLAADDLGAIRAAINQAIALRELGFYRRALNTLSNVEQSLIQLPDSSIKSTGLRNYGDILYLVGEVERSRQVLKDSLQTDFNLHHPSEKVKTWLALGNTYKTSDPQQALKIYRQSLNVCSQDPNCLSSDLVLQANLAIVNLSLDSSSSQWQDSQKAISAIYSELARLPDNKVNLDRKVNFANALIELNHKSGTNKPNKNNFARLITIDRFLQQIIERAKAIDYQKAQSYSWGLRGQIQEQLQNFNLAQKYTQQGLILSQKLNAPEIIYLWQWQLGRINRALGERSQAIAHYTRAVELLKTLSRDLVAIDPDVRYSFQEGVEPVYRQLVSLLLTSDRGAEIDRANLEGAREVIESLQLAELNDFFREACLNARAIDIDKVDRQAAVIYPIILDDRLEIILSLPDRPLQHHTVDIERNKLEAVVEQFRDSIVVRSRRQFYHSAQQLYSWLIRPILADLHQSDTKTLVFVPDGMLRNIPLGALYDGKQYLIENYSLALTPGLQLLAPRSLKETKLKTLAAGITKSRQGFAALNYVDSELSKIKATFDGVVLVDREFTSQTLKQEIQSSDYPIVHIATHGKFSSSVENTFLLAWDDKLNISQLNSILQTRSFKQENAIELLVLSACETATGDKRAALGLAGMAVRAGARSTLATLWSVNDRATTKLMSDFYHELSDKHLTKADAVRQAQLSLLHSRGYEHPFYWAPYVLLGNWL